ncbi:hypothetical protein M885DRAFT_559258, partial [Pelagophyceae sp. CCMP2097]
CCSWDGCGKCGKTTRYCAKNEHTCANCDGEWCEAPPDVDDKPDDDDAPASCCSWDGCGECGETTRYCARNQHNCEACNGEWCDDHDPPDVDDDKPDNDDAPAACCSWDGCGECGETTRYCARNKHNCEVHCDGDWCGGDAPPDAPPCVDSPTWVKAKTKVTGNYHGCAWIAEVPDTRCEKLDADGTSAADACPVACSMCP